MGLLKLADKYGPEKLDRACTKALQYSYSPSYKSIKNILAADKSIAEEPERTKSRQGDGSRKYGITRGARHYGGNRT